MSSADQARLHLQAFPEGAVTVPLCCVWLITFTAACLPSLATEKGEGLFACTTMYEFARAIHAHAYAHAHVCHEITRAYALCSPSSSSCRCGSPTFQLAHTCHNKLTVYCIAGWSHQPCSGAAGSQTLAWAVGLIQTHHPGRWQIREQCSSCNRL